jgi:hypothetical protein
MLLEIMTICSLISVSPYYDCSEKWEIMIYSQPPMIECNNYDQFYVSFGCTKLDQKVIHMVHFPEHRDKFGYSILQHELKHMSCKCNFHT